MLLLIICLGLFFLADTVADADLWGHIRYGLDILDARGVPRTDRYSFWTEGVTWIDPEWLSDLILAATYRHVGMAGLVTLKVMLMAVVLVLMARALRKSGVSVWLASVLMCGAIVALRDDFRYIGPTLFGLACLAILLSLLREVDEGRPMLIWATLPLFAIWANLESGFLAGLAILGGWSTLTSLRPPAALAGLPSGARWRSAFLGAVSAAALVTVLNPYGVHLHRAMLALAWRAAADVGSWQPMGLGSHAGWVYLLLMVGWVAAWLLNRSGLSTGDGLVLAVLTVAPMILAWAAPWFVISAAILGSRVWASVSRRLLDRATRWPRVPQWVSGAIVGAACLLPLLGAPWSHSVIRIDPDHQHVPTRVVHMLKSTRIEGNLVVPVRWGSYAAWHLWPLIRVSMDGRLDEVYTAQQYHQSLALIEGTHGWEELLNREDVSLVLLDRLSLGYDVMRHSPGWVFVYKDPTCGLFVRADRVDLIRRWLSVRSPALPVDGRGLVFPGPEFAFASSN